MNQVELPSGSVEAQLSDCVISTLFCRLERQPFVFENFSWDEQLKQVFTRNMAYEATQSENNCRETTDVTQKIEQTVNSAWLLIGIHIYSENLLVHYFFRLDFNLC